MSEIYQHQEKSPLFLPNQTPKPPSKSALETLRQKAIEKYGINEDHIIDLKEYKLSTVLHDFLSPYITGEETEEEYHQLISLGVLAWNLSFLNKKEQKQMLDEFFQPNPLMSKDSLELISDIKSLIKQMIVTKRRYFAQYKRFIIDFELKEEGDEFKLAIISQPI